MPKISQVDEVPCQAEVRILQTITLKGKTVVSFLSNAEQIKYDTIRYKSFFAIEDLSEILKELQVPARSNLTWEYTK